MTPAAAIEEHSFRGEPAITLRAGELAATFVPDVGMTGVSLRYRGREHLALPGGLDALRAGPHRGVAPARAMGQPARVASLPRRGRRRRPSWSAPGHRRQRTAHPRPARGQARLARRPTDRARCDSRGSPRRSTSTRRAFPFPHRIELAITARDGTLAIDTTIVPTGRRRVPVAFGWHPYLKVPGTPRSRWRLQPARAHPLGARPTRDPHRRVRHRAARGSTDRRRTFDDLYELGRGPPPRVRGRRRRRDRSCTVDAAIRTRRSGCRRADRSPRSSR